MGRRAVWLPSGRPVVACRLVALGGVKLLLINSVQLIREQRRRRGIGRYLTGLARWHLDSDARLVALHASPFELRTSTGAKPQAISGNQKPRRWGACGRPIVLQGLQGHIYVLDPSMIALDEAVERLRLGLDLRGRSLYSPGPRRSGGRSVGRPRVLAGLRVKGTIPASMGRHRR